MKKLALTVLLTSASLFAQGQPQEPPRDQTEIALNTAGCGPSQVSFDVTADKNQHPLLQPEAAKAVVYVFNSTGGYIAKIGVDGTWVGANRPRSYFSFLVDPGDHHLCVSFQGDHLQGAAASLTAVAGQSHYFRLFLKEGYFWDCNQSIPRKGTSRLRLRH